MTIRIDPGTRTGEVKQYWTTCVGSCHASTALRQDWRDQLTICHRELGFQYVRFHGLFDDDMSVCLRGNDGSLVYSFFNVDSIFDFLLSIGMRPFIELSYMPEALASGDETVFHYKGNITPPRSYDEWGNLVGALADHLVRRYGIDEVATWFFEVWNEPNLDIFWSGSMEEYFALYESAARAVKSVDSSLKVGGPSTAIDAWIPELREYCSRKDLPLDYISTHHYPTDASYGLGLNMEEQMARSERGILNTRVRKAVGEAGPLPLYYTEWNNSPSPRDPYHDTSYNAAFIVKTLMDNLGMVDIYSFWTFSDIFEEAGLSSLPFHGGFGLLTIHGVRKPSYRAFELLSKFTGHRVAVTTDDGSETVECAAAVGNGKIVILLSNHQVPLTPIRAHGVTLLINSSRDVRTVSVERIDENHANPRKAWLEMGSPEYPNSLETDALHRASEVATEAAEWTFDDGLVRIDLPIDPHAVVAVTLDL